MERAGVAVSSDLRSAFTRPPAWVAEAVVAQIFPDRFRRSGRVAAQQGLALQPWGDPPTPTGFQGGDLYGVIEGLDHLQALGITCLYLTPIFSSAANHRYHAYDYFQVDPLLGGDQAFDALVAELKRRGMRLILDGVFNHCGRGFWAFHHLLENGPASPYVDWFITEHWPLKPYPEPGEPCGYHSWWCDPALPKFNHANQQVREHLLAVGRHWIERGIDGWRLDVPDEVEPSFWVEFRRVVREANPEAWIVGEIWGDARAWLGGEHFDGVMNYRVAWSCLGWVADGRLQQGHAREAIPYGCLSGERWKEVLLETLSWYRPEVNQAQLNLLDSHDVPRALHMLQGDVDALKLALVLLFVLPGVPCVYYGTEAGLSGGAEPECREAFPWGDPQAWPQDLRAFIASLAALRREQPALRSAELAVEVLQGPDGDQGLRLVRGAPGGEQVEVVLNRSRRVGLEVAGLEGRSLLWACQKGCGVSVERLGPQQVSLRQLWISSP
ncbi:glycoside hydrolase family 13 protein [Synechococcus sp. CB0101]|uniref:glycoside hydrolase family 13 protein n=1 Tax=Synechococcus sp. CB0101 TaxID=232348 RepID=UPI0002001503|nr:glycoside hydrolase family 13 protein [Synechococcus sp. CB0101]